MRSCAASRHGRSASHSCVRVVARCALLSNLAAIHRFRAQVGRLWSKVQPARLADHPVAADHPAVADHLAAADRRILNLVLDLHASTTLLRYILSKVLLVLKF